MVAVQRNLRKFGIKEIARTGKVICLHSWYWGPVWMLFFIREHWYFWILQIALRREKMGATAPFWRFSAASYPDLESIMPVKSTFGSPGSTFSSNSDMSSGVSIASHYYQRSSLFLPKRGSEFFFPFFLSFWIDWASGSTCALPRDRSLGSCVRGDLLVRLE